MEKTHPQNPFERYADDLVVHCTTQEEAKGLKDSIEQRLAYYKLQLHPEKTRIIYCKDSNRRGQHPNKSFDFLGFTFRPRFAKDRWGQYFISYLPAISTKAAVKIRQTIKKWKIGSRTDMSIGEIGNRINPILRGWINYYRQFYRSELYSLFQWLDTTLCRWVMKKYRRMKRRAYHWLGELKKSNPGLLAHWKIQSATGR